MTGSCETCRFAVHGCASYYGTRELAWWVEDCERDGDVRDGVCEEYEEYEAEEGE